jgi:mannitol-1-phosphate 5-dehydrogenase
VLFVFFVSLVFFVLNPRERPSSTWSAVAVPKFVQFGAGNIGRGFTGQLFSDAGYELVFVDVRPEIVAALNEQGCYRLRFAGPTRHEEREIGPARAVDGRDLDAVARELAEADLACTAVGVGALPHLAPVIAEGLRRRAACGGPPLDLLLCENQFDVGMVFRMMVAVELSPEHATLIDRIGFVETVVSRMVPELSPQERAADPLLVVVEDYDRLPVSTAFRGPIPRVPGLFLTRRFAGFFERKLYTHNLGHAVAAYLGYMAGSTYIHEVVTDPGLAARVRGAMDEAGIALVARWGFTEKEQRAHAEELMRRFANAELRDTVVRVGRDPLRKLRREDRLVGGALLAMEHGVEPRQIAAGIAAALRFDVPGDRSAIELQRRLQADGAPGVIREVCGLPPEHPLTRLVLEAYS